MKIKKTSECAEIVGNPEYIANENLSHPKDKNKNVRNRFEEIMNSDPKEKKRFSIQDFGDSLYQQEIS